MKKLVSAQRCGYQFFLVHAHKLADAQKAAQKRGECEKSVFHTQDLCIRTNLQMRKKAAQKRGECEKSVFHTQDLCIRTNLQMRRKQRRKEVSMIFLKQEQIEQFRGTGEKNAQGQTLEEFLDAYNPRKYLNPSNTVDILVFTYTQEQGKRQLGKLLLIKRSNHPCIGQWATPGGFIEFKESIEAAAKRELEEETGLRNVELLQLGSYGEYDRDPRTRIITTAYIALVPEGSVQAVAGDDAKDAEWFDIQLEQTAEQRGAGEAKDGERENGEAEEIKKEESEIRNLILHAPKRQLSICAKVRVTVEKKSIFQKKQYELVESQGIAADHGAIIVEALDFIRKFVLIHS